MIIDELQWIQYRCPLKVMNLYQSASVYCPLMTILLQSKFKSIKWDMFVIMFGGSTIALQQVKCSPWYWVTGLVLRSLLHKLNGFNVVS